MSRHGEITLADSVEQPHLGSAFGLRWRQSIVDELSFVPVSRAIFGAVSAVEDGLELRYGRATMAIVSASLNVKITRVRPVVASARGQLRHCGCYWNILKQSRVVLVGS